MRLPTVCIVDDDEPVRDSIAELVTSVGLEAATFGSAQQYLDSFDPGLPGCLVLDVRMAHMSGPALQARLTAMGATVPIVFVSGHAELPVAIRAIKAGAVDFVQKPYSNQQLLDSINEALRKDMEARTARDRRSSFAQRAKSLTDRERQVMELVVTGQSSKAIAKALGISHRTVEVHRSHLLEKLGARTVSELIHLAGR